MRKIFYRFEDAVRYQRKLKAKGVSSTICHVYNWSEQAEEYIVQPD